MRIFTGSPRKEKRHCMSSCLAENFASWKGLQLSYKNYWELGNDSVSAIGLCLLLFL